MGQSINKYFPGKLYLPGFIWIVKIHRDVFTLPVFYIEIFIPGF